MTAWPPRRAISSNSAWLALTSARIGAPGWRASTSAARICISWSPNMIRPWPSTTPIRSPSPSKAMPRSAPPRRTAAIRSVEILRDRRIGMMVGEAAVDVGEQQLVPARQAGGHGAERLARAPLPASHTTRAAGPRGNRAPAGRHRHPARASRSARPSPLGEGALRREPAQLLDLRAVKRLLAEHHLEAVVARAGCASR